MMREGLAELREWRMATPMERVALGYGAALVAAEGLALVAGLGPSAVVHAALLALLLGHVSTLRDAGEGRILLALALLPLLRLLSVVMPVQQVTGIYTYALVGLPLLVAVILVVQRLGVGSTLLARPIQGWPVQGLIALGGLPLGLLAFLLFRPAPLLAAPSAQDLVVGALVLMVATGFLEEIIFRGLLQGAATDLWPAGGVLYSSALFAAMYLGSLSPLYLVFVALVGLLFGWLVQRTGSLWGVAIAHGLLNVGLLLVWPLALG